MILKMKTLWCIAKTAAIRETANDGSKIIGRVRFGKPVYVCNSEIVNSRVKIIYSDSPNVSKRGKKIAGWVHLKAFTGKHVKDYAKLFFDNLTGKPVFVCDRYKGKITGYILPNEQVKMVARVGDWCLTSRGWTMFSLLTKNADIIDMLAITELYYGVLKQAVSDYQHIIMRLKKRAYKDRESYCYLMNQLNELTRWFNSAEYAMMYDDVPGCERLDDIHHEMGIDDKWLEERHRIHREIKQRGGGRS